MISQQIAAELRDNFDGTPWHGLPLRRLVSDVNPEKAHAHPVPDGHSIAELLAHTIAWIEIVERRLLGENFEVTPEIDFPSVDGVAWATLLARLDAAHDRLIHMVEQMPDEKLRENVAGKKYTAKWMLRGLAHHNTYHGAQIAMLKKF
ncbi:MAG TPA: DinB family protein [Thermoanaerobaculia bacterium]